MPKLEQSERSDGGVQSLVLALRMLEALTFSGKPCRITDLAAALGTSKNRVHRYLQTLVELGYAVRDDDVHRYAVGIRLVQLGSAAANQYDLLTVSRPVMRQLRDAVGHAVVLSRVISGQLYAIERIDGMAGITVGLVIGSPLGLHSSAQGKVVLAFGPKELLEGVTAAPLEARTPQTITSAGRLRREVDAVRKRGWAIAPGETMTGLNALAGPILDADGALFATLGILGPLDVLPTPPPDRIVAALLAATAEIGSKLHGGRLQQPASSPNPSRRSGTHD